jgi:hypothetical protein
VDLIAIENYPDLEEPKILLDGRSSLIRRRRVLEAAGVEFTNGDLPGVRLRKGES